MKAITLISLALTAGCAAQPQDIRTIITPASIAASTTPLLFVELKDTSQQAIMSLTGRNDDVVTWSTADGKSISLRNGILVATRGFGFDLMSAEVTGTIVALNGGPRVYERFATYLDGTNRTVIRSFSCTMSGPQSEVINSFDRVVQVYLWIEDCSSLEGNVQSEFWLAGNDVWRTTQQGHTSLGEILTERLNSD
jgi:hypothetical protein